MCGIFGQINQPDFSENDFRAILQSGRHRGPDHTGYAATGNMQFGFNRLSVLDITETGHQPMYSPQKKFIIVFNGEIYNYEDIRKALPALHYRGTGDTEVITHALDVWGVDKTIETLDGMFAIAVYELSSQCLYLARDFAGIKPLFFAQKGKAVVFASEYSQVMQHPLFRNNSVNEQALRLYLEQQFIPAPLGLHEGTGAVRPGEIIKFDEHGNRSYKRYWELPLHDAHTVNNSNEAEQYIAETLDCCVQSQLVADVPVGAFLSGGIDSALICANAVKHKKDLQVFTIGSDSPMHDESIRAAESAGLLHVKQNIWTLDAGEMMKYWHEAVACIHEPFADFSILPTYLVSKLARKHVTVALSGDGGDELFFGYERFHSVSVNTRFMHLPLWMRKGIYGFDKYISNKKKYNANLIASSQAQAHRQLHSRFAYKWLEQIAPAAAHADLPEAFDAYQYADATDERQLMCCMRRAEFYGMMQKTLRKVDMASMQNSLEVRVPFLQKKFIEASLKIDPALSYGGGKKKQMLKNLLKTELPALKDDNIKRGFTVQLGKWIKETLRPEFEDKLLHGNCNDYGLNTKAMKAMLDAHCSGQADYKWPLFTLYALLK